MAAYASAAGPGHARGDGRVCIAIDLKSFYASVECVERGLDPLNTNLVVADETRTDKTICLAVSPSLKRHGIPGRPRLFEAKERLRRVNAARAAAAPGRRLAGESCDARDLERSPWLKASMIIAKPHMAHYLEVSGRIYGIYLRYAAPEHIHVYSVDEVFIDATPYLKALGMAPHGMAVAIVRDILSETGITATAGIGTNLYLAKVAMDIVAKHMPADKDGVRVAELDEMSYRRLLWDHRPLTDFWRVGRGYAKRLERAGLMTMGDIARCSVGRASDYYNEELLYRMFGVNAELLIDHAWGWEPCTIEDIRSYEPDAHSTSIGQVLTGPADWGTARLIVKEMADALALDLVGKGVRTNRVTLAVGYDIGSLDAGKLDDCEDPATRLLAERAAESYHGPVSVDHYGRKVPKPAVGSLGLGEYTSSSARIRRAMAALFERIVDPRLLVRRLTVVADDLATDGDLAAGKRYEQPDLFAQGDAGGDGLGAAGSAAGMTGRSRPSASGGRPGGNDGVRSGDDSGGRADGGADRDAVDRTLLEIKRRFGKNAVVKAMNMEPGATGIERNNQIGGHHR
ncbi:Y-family DNA polymerase [Bifidobacterium platyrrhinorum]|uniref:Type VI secretion protein ImpB n=1 Tax=Bifidobacterium platyrrhinorum TaxID=2661628 RepID=A0A6L9SPA0_9BIFI|nr:type VI secretion protein ImpB [Bifidobacterium platyrrhinorum]NEG54274.1 type VI secretion protein ImpB [Bifidobacterium platyrrhinorum]